MADDFNDIAEALYEEGEALTFQAMREELAGNAQALYDNSVAFLQQQKETIEEIKRQNQLAAAQRKVLNQIKKTKDVDTAAALTAQLQNMEKERALEQKSMERFMDAFFLYHQQLNMFLNQEVHLVYVYRDAYNNPTLYVMQEQGLLMTSELASKHRGIISRFQRESMFTEQGRVLERASNKFKFNLEGLITAYKETLYRAARSKEEHHSGKIIILWCPGSTWLKMSVSSEGDLSEAYAAYYLRNEPHPSFTGGLEILVNDFLVGGSGGSESAVKNVDPTSGLLQGDISIKNSDGSTLEFAVKSAGASSMGIPQVIKFAEEIVSKGPGGISTEWANTIKKELEKSGRNKIVSGNAKALKNTSEQLIQKLEQEYAKRSIQITYPIVD